MRPYRSIDDIAKSLRESATVHAFDGPSLTYSKAHDAWVAESLILWATKTMMYPYEFAIRAMGTTVEDAVENLAKELDDWQVQKALNIPTLLDKGAEYLLVNYWEDPTDE